MQDRNTRWRALVCVWVTALTAAFAAGGAWASVIAAPAVSPAVAATPTDRLPALVLGVFPRFPMPRAVAMFTPLAEYLTTAVGREVRLEVVRDFPTFWRQVELNRYDLVHYNQYHYIKARRLFGHRLIARNVEAGADTVISAIIVRSDANIDSLTALKHKTIMFGRGRQAMQGYIAPTYLLRKRGLYAGDYDEDFARTPCDAVTAVYRHQAAASASPLSCISDNPLVDGSKLKVLAQTEPLARSPWAVTKSVSPMLARRIGTALTRLHTDTRGRAILARAQLTGLVAATDVEYARVRAITAEALNERY